jgi:hypothetical protein
MSQLTHGGDLEWCTWKRGEKIFSIPAKREAESNGAEEPKAPRPEDYTFVGR